MAKDSFVCPDCGEKFGAKWTLTDHGKSCPVKQSAELRRVQEQLEWQKSRVESWIKESYRSAARAFSAYHNSELEMATRMHQWFAEDFDLRIRDLEVLSDAVGQAQRVHFPRMSRLASDVALLLEQAKELASMLSTLNRDYGVRR